MSFNDNQRNKKKNSVRKELKTGNTAVSWHLFLPFTEFKINGSRQKKEKEVENRFFSSPKMK